VKKKLLAKAKVRWKTYVGSAGKKRSEPGGLEKQGSQQYRIKISVKISSDFRSTRLK